MLDVKRKIPITKIVAITVSKYSSEFVLHVPEEYDYRYSSADKYDFINFHHSTRRDEILQILSAQWSKLHPDKKGLAFYYKVVEWGVWIVIMIGRH